MPRERQTVSTTGESTVSPSSERNGTMCFLRMIAIVTAVLGGACALAAERVPAGDQRFPDFSWDTIPLYMHVRKATAFTDEELDYLASFPLITLEKTTGLRSSGSTDQGTIVAAEAIKERNPRAKVLFYRNVLVHYGGYSFDGRLSQIPNPFLVDMRGKTQLVRNTAEAYDLSNPQVVAWWVDTALEVCRHDAIDGLFLDGNIKALTPYLSRQLPPGKKDAVTAGYHDMVRRLRADTPKSDLLIANIIRAAYFPDAGLGYLDAFDGTYIEGFDVVVGKDTEAELVAKGIAALQQAARAGKIVAMTLGLGESAADDTRIDDTRAHVDGLEAMEDRVNYLIGLFLVCAERYSYLYVHDGYSAELRRGECQSKVWLKRFPQYDKPLGPPLGPATRNGLVYTRRFKHVDVSVDLEKKQARLDWLPPRKAGEGDQ
jgi:hypothetical protein